MPLQNVFRTVLPVKAAENKIGLQSSILTLGSCFSDAMGKRFLTYKLRTLSNPFGTIFNPIAVFNLLDAACGKAYNFEHDLVQNNGIWYCYSLHSIFSSENKQELLAQIDEAVKQTSEFIKGADYLILTLGTAIAYKLNSSEQIVANCHKIPQKNFTKQLLNTSEIEEAFSGTLKNLLHIRPSQKILITVSPVRHIKETLELNSVSKSILRLACHNIQLQHEQVQYFPSYEIMMDDLRDYRFYSEDMIHPTILAEDYIWEHFAEAYFNDELRAFLPEWQNIIRALNHKPFHPNSAAHQLFLQNTIAKLEQLQSYFHISTSAEIAQLKHQLNP